MLFKFWPCCKVIGFILGAINFALKYDYGRNYIFGQAKSGVMKLTQGLYPAPLKIIEVIL